MCGRWERQPLISSWAICESGNPSTDHQAEWDPSPEEKDPIAPKTILEIAITFPIAIDVSGSTISNIRQTKLQTSHREMEGLQQNFHVTGHT